MRLSREQFRELVLEALEGLPEDFLDRMDNCDVVTQDWPDPHQLDIGGSGGRYDLLGLYEGVPLTERDSYDLVLPDKITLFQRPIEAICPTKEEVVEQVRITVAHEIAHHFGIDDETLEELGLG